MKLAHLNILGHWYKLINKANGHFTFNYGTHSTRWFHNVIPSRLQNENSPLYKKLTMFVTSLILRSKSYPNLERDYH